MPIALGGVQYNFNECTKHTLDMAHPFTLSRIVQFIGLVVFMIAALQGLILHINGLSMPASQFVNEHLWEAVYTWVSLVLGVTGMFIGAAQRQSVPHAA